MSSLELSAIESESNSRPYGAAAALALLALSLALLCKKLFNYEDGGAMIWFADAAGIAFLYRHKLRDWPLLLAGLIAGNVCAALILDYGVALALGYAVPSVAEATAAAALLRYVCPRGDFFDGLVHWLRFIVFGALAPTIAGAGIGTLVTVLAFGSRPLDVFVGWYFADAIGILVFLPIALMYRGPISRWLFDGRAAIDFFATGIAAIALIELLLLAFAPYPFAFISLPLIWAASRLQLMPTLMLIFAVMLLLVDQIVANGAPLVHSNPEFNGPMLVLYCFAAILPAYVVAVATNIERIKTQRLVEAEGSFRSAMENSRIGMLFVSRENRILRANPSFCCFLGYTERELIGRTVFDITCAEDLPQTEAHCAEQLDGGNKTLNIEKRYVRKDGRVVWGHLTTSLALGEQNQLLYVVAQVEDIDWRKRSEEQLAHAEERWKFSLMVTAQGVYDWDLDAGRVEYSDWLRSCLGIAQSTMNAREDWLARVHRDDLHHLLVQQSRHLRGESPIIDCEYRVRTDSGDYRWINESAKVMECCDTGRPRRLIGIFRDITRTRELARSLAEEKEHLQVTLSAIADAVIATDVKQCINYMNPVAEHLTGWTLEQVKGRPIESVLDMSRERDGKSIPSPVGECLSRGEPAIIAENILLRSRDGSSYDIKCSASPLKTDSGNWLGAVLVFQDISESRQLIRQLSYKASHDDLTRLPNRDAFKRELAQAVESVSGSDDCHVLAYIDLDRFKVINDSAGHQAGDALLKKIAKALRSQLRSSDSVARLGGDEFGLLFRHCNKEQAQLRCEQVVNLIAGLRFPWKGRVYDVGASVGITEIHRSNNRVGDLLSQADVACYSAKHAGRGIVMTYEMDQSAAAEQHREIIMASAIRAALDEQRLSLHAQPIAFADENRRISHYEILVRMRDENGKLIMPGAFIPAAERYGLMLQIDRWVTREVLVNSAEQIARSGIYFALNISAEALGDAGFQAYLLGLLERTEIPARQISFEITETAMVNQMESASQFVESLRDMGCRVALDDFGNGLSSFNYLKAFAIDFIKIDGSFIRQVESNFVDLMIVESINQIAHRLNARTIAEYVEDASTAERLRTVGVDLVQGFHIGRPQPLEQLFGRRQGRGAEVLPLVAVSD